ncbi:26s proteasome non-atpase regulatory subunit 4 [Anaeramoeba flamelloides]|uniref:26s proteasome non-atpase regulatory subunit n=1 Tax=Anaeramoeba flamelloides TaxID=1746091 RepID=A0AAV8AC31_9EUKA|nr:26s proteasome non-atpase regulatory subunit [Anaeramoeba flamelloides]KAJ6228034.1 26s proteasome non-atpase regulatory subunit 4 [Anaeramoeba flamelloides]
MVLEACVILVDNSNHSRNGDFAPNRFLSQIDSISFIAGSKIQQNRVNTVGILAMSGRRPNLVLAPTNDVGQVLIATNKIQIEGKLDLISSIEISQLSLKHRSNKEHAQRIIMFVASPLEEKKEDLEKIGSQLRKASISIDIISFGETERNEEKLSALIDNANSGDNCHLLSVPTSTGIILADQIQGSGIFSSSSGGMGGGYEGGFGGGGYAGGMVDPNVDPELAMVLQMSLEEERQRQSRLQQENNNNTNEKEGNEQKQEEKKMDLEETEESSQNSNKNENNETKEEPDMFSQLEGLTEEEQMELIMKMSLEEMGNEELEQLGIPNEEEEETEKEKDPEVQNALQDEDLVDSILLSLPGVDPENEEITETINNIKKENNDEEKDKEKKNEND